MLKINDKAPDFELKDKDGNKVKLSSFKGKNIILYFYPKDMTPGCKIEACEFRDNFSRFRNSVIIGISTDNEESHRKFSDKYKLPFILLCDINKDISEKYEVYGKKSFTEKKYFGVNRTTFIIDKDMRIKYIFNRVNPKGHAEEVLEKI